MYEAILERLKGLHPKVIDLALDRVERVLLALGSPEQALPPVIHIAGTNGKGSTQAGLRAILEAAGKSVHAYTSPHLVRFAERIRVAGALITDAALEDILLECEEKNAGKPITFFEITTAAAFLAFSRTPADVCLLETGLGGRVDATNVLAQPLLTILTPISLDHQSFLGRTVAAIAAEKAGILKQGVPCVCAAQEPDALRVITAQAMALGVPLIVEGRDWSIEETPLGLNYSFRGRNYCLPRPALAGSHQIQNAGVMLTAALLLADLLPGLEISDLTLAQGLRAIEWPARLQRLSRGVLASMLPPGAELWLDGGHNPAAGRILARVATGWRDRPLDVIVGMLNTKDSHGFLEPLAPEIRSLQAVTIPGEANALSAEQVVQAAGQEGILAVAADSVTEAIQALVRQGDVGRILICGSLYLAGDVLRTNGEGCGA